MLENFKHFLTCDESIGTVIENIVWLREPCQVLMSLHPLSLSDMVGWFQKSWLTVALGVLFPRHFIIFIAPILAAAWLNKWFCLRIKAEGTISPTLIYLKTMLNIFYSSLGWEIKRIDVWIYSAGLSQWASNGVFIHAMPEDRRWPKTLHRFTGIRLVRTWYSDTYFLSLWILKLDDKDERQIEIWGCRLNRDAFVPLGY